jgi:hypothetical protein
MGSNSTIKDTSTFFLCPIIHITIAVIVPKKTVAVIHSYVKERTRTQYTDALQHK